MQVPDEVFWRLTRALVAAGPRWCRVLGEFAIDVATRPRPVPEDGQLALALVERTPRRPRTRAPGRPARPRPEVAP